MLIQSAAASGKVNAQSSLSQDNKITATELAQSFGQYLKDALNQLNAQQAEVEMLRDQFISGQMTDPHALMIAAEKASLGLELTVQVRNKVIEAYQEIMRTQI